MIRSGILVAMLAVWLFSCARSDTRHEVYYPIDSLIQAQISYLADPRHPAFLHKFATLGAHRDTVLYQPRDSAAWASELGPLLRLGVINKPIHQGKYAVEDNLPDPGSNLRVRAYNAQDAELPIEYLKIYYRDSLKHIRRIEGAYREANALYRSTQFFTMELQEVHNKIMLTSYSIRGGQKMILADSMMLDVDGHIALDRGVNNIIDSYGKKNREGTVEGGREAETQ